jgi:hypothetical protein
VQATCGSLRADKFTVSMSTQGWQVFAGSWKKPVFSMEKTVPAKIVFAGWKKPPGKNPAKLGLQTFTRWKKYIFDRHLISK